MSVKDQSIWWLKSFRITHIFPWNLNKPPKSSLREFMLIFFNQFVSYLFCHLAGRRIEIVLQKHIWLWDLRFKKWWGWRKPYYRTNQNVTTNTAKSSSHYWNSWRIRWCWRKRKRILWNRWEGNYRIGRRRDWRRAQWCRCRL